MHKTVSGNQGDSQPLKGSTLFRREGLMQRIRNENQEYRDTLIRLFVLFALGKLLYHCLNNGELQFFLGDFDD